MASALHVVMETRIKQPRREHRYTFWSPNTHTHQTYTSIKKKNICDIATTPPMKNPTAIELWNFLMIIVPPILSAKSISADHIDVKVSLKPRVDMTAQDMSARTPVKPRMEYLLFVQITQQRKRAEIPLSYVQRKRKPLPEFRTVPTTSQQ